LGMPLTKSFMNAMGDDAQFFKNAHIDHVERFALDTDPINLKLAIVVNQEGVNTLNRFANKEGIIHLFKTRDYILKEDSE